MSNQDIDKCWIRDLHGKVAVFAGISRADDTKVVVCVQGEGRIMTSEEWNSLPRWNGPDPLDRS